MLDRMTQTAERVPLVSFVDANGILHAWVLELRDYAVSDESAGCVRDSFLMFYMFYMFLGQA